MLRALLLWLTAATAALQPAPPPAPPGYQSSVARLPASIRLELKKGKVWTARCPVGLSQLRVLTVSYRGFDGRPHIGQMVVNEAATGPLARAFHRLYAMRFPIHHMSLEQVYGPPSAYTPDHDPTASFQCRQAAASPCTGRKTTGSWSMHAYGLAVDVNPAENPYVGCGQAHDPKTLRYSDRSRLRRGMITPKVEAAFGSVGWGWGGSWSGSTKDYMHFSSTGH
jgi:hypothetical protein